MASNSKDLMLSSSQFVLFDLAGLSDFHGCTYPLASPASPPDQGAALRHRLSPHSLLIQFAMPSCKEAESNSANEECFYKIHGCYLLQIYLFQWCSTTGL